MPNLPTPQVQALADCEQNYGVVFDANGIQVDADAVSFLALEVLAHRERRCGNCRHWDRLADQSTVHAGMGWCYQGHETYCGWTKDTWQCGDFTPKEPK